MFESEQTAEADPNDAVATDFVYDEAGRLIKVILPEVPDPANGDTLTNPQYDYEYDIYGNLVKITDPNLRQTTFTYNELHKQTSRTLAGGPAEYKDYDEYGRLILAEDFAGRITTFEYNGRGQLGAKRYYPSWNYYENYPDDPCSVISYEYDDLGRKTGVILDGEQWQYWYDIEGQVAKIKAPQGWIAYEYYDTGRKKSVSAFAANLSYGDIAEGNEDSRVEYIYDELGRLYNVKLVKVNGQTVWPEDITMYGYDEAGVLDWVCLPNGNCADYEYDQLNRLISLENRNSLDQVLTKYEYGLLANGMRGSVIETLGQEETTLQWTYDNLDRLLSELCYETADPCNVIYQDSYVYDLVSDRISKTADDATMYYHYNENDQLLAESSDEEGLIVSLSYLYDDNGSLIKKVYGADTQDDPNDSYEYDLRNKLMRFVNSDGDVIGYSYDPDGIRVEKESGGTATEYLIDPDNLTGYSQVFSESDGVDTLTYIIGLDVLAQVAGGTPQYFEYDGHGSVRRLTDDSGAVIGSPDNEQIYHYDAYGNSVLSPQNPLTNLRYVGEYYNPLPGLYGLRARDYGPLAGRFMTHDPFEGNLQDPMSLHRYLYCYAEPINNVDPLGLFTQRFGYLAEAAIQAIYAIDHPGDSVSYGGWTRLGPVLGRAFRLKPDIMNHTGHRNNNQKTWLEIKPLSLSGAVRAGVQYRLYNETFSFFGYKPEVLWTPSTHFATAGQVQIFFFNAGGIVFYTDIMDNLEDIAALATVQAVKGFLRSPAGRRLVTQSITGVTSRIPRLVGMRAKADEARLKGYTNIAVILTSLGGGF